MEWILGGLSSQLISVERGKFHLYSVPGYVQALADCMHSATFDNTTLSALDNNTDPNPQISFSGSWTTGTEAGLSKSKIFPSMEVNFTQRPADSRSASAVQSGRYVRPGCVSRFSRTLWEH